ncbi:MAG TPA: lysophospholipid acyltransferase family protein [Fimbriimonadaceae bacterium]|nr:lysophospholipid acyltransferase family protein [Fimbriimonadaceae bacterium]
MKAWWRRVRPRVLSAPIAALVRLIGLTLRIKTVNEEAFEKIEGGKILCGWHGRSSIAGAKYRDRGFWVVISLSKDGDIQNNIFRKLGFNTIRGSTGRGGERALVESIKVLRQGATMAMTPDGPRGPSGACQGGVLLMAKKSGAALVPVGISSRPRILLKNAWDRHMIPVPFGKSMMVFGEPYYVPKDASDEAVEEIRLKMQEDMHALQEEAERQLGQPVTSRP